MVSCQGDSIPGQDQALMLYAVPFDHVKRFAVVVQCCDPACFDQGQGPQDETGFYQLEQLFNLASSLWPVGPGMG